MTPDRPAAGRARFERWVRDHHAAVFQSAWRITRNASDAEDVAQQVFLRVLESPAAVADHAEPERALRWLAVKTALTFRRGETNRHRREEEQAMRTPETSRDARPDDDAARRERLAAVRAKVAALPDELRLATVLRFQEGLTFAAMAELEGVSEPTMFERVKRSLEKLRGALTQAGHAAVVVDLESLLAVEEVASVPAKLGATLLALSPAAATTAATVATTSSTTGWLAAAAAVIVVAVGGALAVRTWHSTKPAEAAPTVARSPRIPSNTPAPRPPSTEFLTSPARTAAERELENPPPPPVPANSATAMRASALLWTEVGITPDAPWDTALVETTHVRGVVVDDDGRTLAKAEVVAESGAGAPKGFRWRASQSTGDDGSFDLRVAVLKEPQRYVLDLVDPDTLPRRIETDVATSAATDVGCVVLRRNLADRAGEWTLRLTLVDPDGAPVNGAGVRLYRKLIARPDATQPADVPPPSDDSQRVFDTGGVTNEQGVVELAGKRVGDKSLQVYARFLGFRDSLGDFTIAAAGFHEQRIVVERGLTLRGRLVAPSGCNGARVDAVPMAGGERYDGSVEADGSFVVAGLDPGKYRLRVDGDFSPGWLDDVEAGRDDVVVELKRADDPRDFGVHRAELHGRIVAAAGGAPLPVDPESTRVIALPADWSPDDPRVFTELVPDALLPQTAQVCYVGDEPPSPPAPSSDFHVTGLDAGSYVFLVSANGFAPGHSRVVTLKEREIAADLVVALARSE